MREIFVVGLLTRLERGSDPVRIGEGLQFSVTCSADQESQWGARTECRGNRCSGLVLVRAATGTGLNRNPSFLVAELPLHFSAARSSLTKTRGVRTNAFRNALDFRHFCATIEHNHGATKKTSADFFFFVQLC